MATSTGRQKNLFLLYSPSMVVQSLQWLSKVG